MSPAAAIAGFLLSAVAVVIAGVHLARSGHVIAARTRLGGVWVGSVFLAIATSLPEVATDIAAVRLGAPDLAAGDLFGSSMANMLILAVLGLLPGSDLFRRAGPDNALAAALAILLTGTAAFVLLLRSPASLLGVSPGSVVIVAGYLAGTRAIFHSSALARRSGGAGEPDHSPSEALPTLRRAIVVLLVAAAVILVAAPVFAASAEALAELTGIATSFIGTWLVGLATSLPELVTSLAAVRMGAVDMAVGNLFGSNALNMTIFALLDLALGGVPILSVVSPAHVLAALVGIALMAVGLAAMAYRERGRLYRLEPGGALMVLIYVAGLVLIFLHSGRA